MWEWIELQLMCGRGEAVSIADYNKLLDDIQRLINYGRTKDDPRDLFQVLSNIAVTAGQVRY
jgi:hypothetical protein